MLTYSGVSPAVLSFILRVCVEPLKGSLHLVLHVLSGASARGESEATHGLRGHLHDDRIVAWQQVAQVVGKATDSCAHVAKVDTNQAHCNSNQPDSL